jgi:pSer/pThr/pTyr-binding forkhead associated (FHA) protein
MSQEGVKYKGGALDPPLEETNQLNMNSAPIPATTWYSIDFFALMTGSTTGEPSNISINPAARLLLTSDAFLHDVEIHFL